MANTRDLKSRGFKPCGFESHRQHHKMNMVQLTLSIIIYGCGGMADAPDLGSGVLDVQVQVLLPVPMLMWWNWQTRKTQNLVNYIRVGSNPTFSTIKMEEFLSGQRGGL